MTEFESYSFSRLYRDENMEFFFILGVNDSDNYDEYWDGRSLEPVGYAVIYLDVETEKQKNFIYLIDKANRNYDDIVKYAKQFIQQMSLSEELSDRENFKVLKTEIKSRVINHPYNAFIKMVVKNEIPEFDTK
ncbi:hypothetical protein HF394_06425 [Planococcus glaciei]|uniref:Uncharacterized protein n=1 Tax=Planococcus glaciei TaxID=459472 RepID=A0A7H8Q9P7_9BACL|nr:hypothetical protein [Planococcus glaciei]QKX50252.1 hypothetical protein HF394_06425 [Planococcus glaciei]